jgi:GNAT superfamily N-acetyltransferase
MMTQHLKGQPMSDQFTFSFTEPINPEMLQLLFQQADWATNRSPLDIQQMLDNSQLTLGVWDDDKLIGFARVITDNIYRAWIEDVVVDEPYHEQGVGSHIIAKLLKRLEHIEDITLHCIAELVPFYEKHGFTNKMIASMHIMQAM